MPDFDALLNRTRNTLLSPERTTGDIVRAGIQSTTGTPYAENLSNIAADKYNRALSQYGVLSSERDFQARREQQIWKRAQAEADRGDKDVQRLLELSGAYGANAADSQRLASWVIQQSEERNIDDPEQVPGLVAEGAQALGLQARPELTLMSTAHGGVVGVDPSGEPRTIVEGQPPAPSAGVQVFDPETGNIIAQVGGTPLTKSQTGAQGIEIADEIRATGERLSELSSSLRSLEETPEATGLRGIVIERVGGVAEQIGDMVGVEGDWIGTAEVQQTRTQLASLLGRYIPTVTGDESNRYSDRDMQRAEAALPATRTTASYNQVRSALLTLGDIERRARARALMRLDGFGPEVDLTYPDGRESYAVQLFREEKSPEEAARIIQELMDKYEITPGLEGIR